jgi:heme oxygenase
LREATRATHARMHELAPFVRIATARLDCQGYAGVLSALWRYHTAIGLAAAGHGLGPLSSSARRTILLEADLAYLGSPERPRPPAWVLSSQEQALGALYVAEGSMLGGRVLARQLDYLFGREPDGRRFFIGRADDRASWQRLNDALAGDLRDDAAIAAAIQGAQASFALFEQCLMDDR